MALVFTETISEGNWIFSDNNNILEFSDDDGGREALHCDIVIGALSPIKIFPQPDFSFWFNTLDYISSLLSDYDLNLNSLGIDPNDIDTFVLDWSKIYINPQIQITVTFDDTSTASANISPNILLGVEQVEDYFKQKTISEKDVAILSPLLDKTNNTYYLKYWKGYPFDIAYTKAISGAGQNISKVKNLSTGVETPAISSPNDVNRLFISNGKLDVTLEDELPLKVGFNKLEFDSDNFVELIKVDSECGTYVRWLNQYGAANYWLFIDSQDSLSSGGIGIIDNDLNSVRNSGTTFKSLGSESQAVKTVRYDSLSSKDIALLSGILESPKISIYTGERFAPNPSGRNWIDVSLVRKNLALKNFKNRVPNGALSFAMPQRYTIKL